MKVGNFMENYRMEGALEGKLMIKETQKKTPLRWSMVMLLILCWILPFTLIAYIMLYVATNNINSQIERTIVTSADNAVKICEMRMDAAVEASKTASYLPTVRASYEQYMRDGDNIVFLKKIKYFLEQHYAYNDAILYTHMFLTDEPELSSFTAYWGSTSNESWKRTERFREEAMSVIMDIYPTLDTDVAVFSVKDSVYLTRNLMTPDYHPYAVLTMELDKEEVFGSLNSTWGYSDSVIYIGGTRLVGDRDSDREGKMSVGKELFEHNNRNVRLLKKGGEYYAYTVRKPDRHYVGYIIALDSQAIIDETYAVKYVCVLFILFMLPLVVIVFIFFHRKVARPIGHLIKASHEIEEGQFGYQIEAPGNSKEFGYLQEAFNSMSARLKHQFETIYSEEMALKDARIMALQSQINPHFLNNTLEIINWEARINENYKVSQMIENLSIMLEATMDRRHRRFVTLAEEMSYVDAYLFIIAQRLGERMHVEKNVDGSLFNEKIPRLIIQPIIENAVEHGISGQTHARIVLNVYAKEDKLVLEVRNTGTMSPEDEEKIKLLLSDDYEPGEFGSASLGIKNVNRRIKIIYGESCGLTVENDGNNETVSRIIVKMDMTTIKDK